VLFHFFSPNKRHRPPTRSRIDGNSWHYLKALDRSDGLYESKGTVPLTP
jgi:hypothetical protein